MKILCFLLLLTGFAYADTYEVNVTREDSNLYQVTGEDILIFTRFCYEYVYYSDAFLRMNGQTGDITFTGGSSSGSCDVAGVYGDMGLDAGAYSITVSREDSNWYKIAETDGYIQTNLCLELALMDDATLEMNSYGTGTLYFSNGDDCDVKKVYGVLQL